VRRAAVLAIGLLEDYSANPILGRALYDQDRVVRTLAQRGLEAIWQRHGTQHQREQLQRLIRLNYAGEYDQSAAIAGKLIRLAPWIAEYWHQRAIARFEQRQVHGSLEDYRQTMTLNPFHYPAAVGMAHCYAHLENGARTLESLQAALRINPSLEEVRARINAILRYT
jgi:tetratricopeptide (TPR) repeat protein